MPFPEAVEVRKMYDISNSRAWHLLHIIGSR